MRVIVAVDGSAGSRLGLDLIKDAGLPRDTGFRVVAVAHGAPGGSAIAMQEYAVGSPYATDPRPTELLTSLEAAKSVLEGAGYVEVDSILLEGRAARAIVDEARGFSADLIVVGHRGRGALTSRLLGSTSAEVIEHAGCAVLVARSWHLGPIMVATDGSEASRKSAELLSRWPLFERFPVTVVSVADVRMPVAIEFQAGVYEQIMKSYLESVEAARTECASRAEIGGRCPAGSRPGNRDRGSGRRSSDGDCRSRERGKDGSHRRRDPGPNRTCPDRPRQHGPQGDASRALLGPRHPGSTNRPSWPGNSVTFGPRTHPSVRRRYRLLMR